MTTYIALSPKRRTEHTTWKEARDALVDDASELAKSKKDAATKAQFAEVAETLRIDTDPQGLDECDYCLRRYDAWGNPITFRIVPQEQFAV